MTTTIDPKNTQGTTPSPTSGNNNFLVPSTVAMYNVLQCLFGQIAYKEGQGEIQMTEQAQKTGVDLAHQVFTKGILQAVGQGVAGLASLGGGIYSGYAMSSAGTSPEIDALEKETSTIKGYQDALKERTPDTKLSDKDFDDALKEKISAKGPEILERQNKLKQGDDLSIDKDRGGFNDKDAINLMGDEDSSTLQGKMNDMYKEKSAALRDERKMSFDQANMKSQAISTISQGAGQIAKAGFDSGVAIEDKAQQLTSQALEMQKKSIENYDQDRKANAQTMAELQQLGQSIERARSAAAN